MFKKFWGIISQFRRPMLVLLLLVCVRELIMLLPARVQGRMVDELVGHRDVSVLAMLIVVTVIISLCYEVVAQYGRVYTARKLSYLIPEHVGNTMFSALFALSIAQQGEENSTYRQSVTDRGQNAVPDLVNTVMQRFLPNLVVVLSGTAVMLWLMPELGLLTLSGSLAYLFLSVYHSWRYRGELKEYEDIRHNANAWRGEVLRFMRFVKASGEEKRVLEETRKHYGLVRDSGEKYNMLIYWSLFGRQVLYIFLRVSVTVVGVLMVLNDRLTPGQLFTSWVWSSMIYNGMSNLGSLQQQLIESIAGVGKYLATLDKKPAIVPIENPIRPDHFEGRIEFRNVSYEYSPRAGETDETENRQALDHVSFRVEPGERIAIVGYTGSGKSTLVNALLRASDPTEGQILIDGNDLRLLDAVLYRGHVGMVEQEPTFFDKTLRFNLTLGLGERADFVGDDELRVACKTAGVDEFFDRLPQGFETRLGEAARTLSGGQRQRLAIARALLKNPDILIFDEATSSLDVVMENRVQEAMQRASHNRTTLVIAHRFSSIRWVEKILVMHEGRVVGFGTHDELLGTCAIYQNLIEHQTYVA